MSRQYLRNFCILGLCLLLAASGMRIFQGGSLPVSARVRSKKLPIYCVQSEAPKVSISFDAAWGNVRMREKYHPAIDWPKTKKHEAKSSAPPDKPYILM